MADGFDLCECLQHHMSVQHLLSIIRQTQDYCTDIECFNMNDMPEPFQGIQEPSNFLSNIFLILGFSVLMYAFRPRRQLNKNIIKNGDNEPGSHHDPPSSPPAAH